ncbi:class I SAM-dependent methyltransferase [Ralstonia pickettii]|uniref:class I SAM-dependent methyltransferase n=1 Tax=Ralstonia pickettii TaxID=329 RepID=UPI002714B582|nr:class I SAM-dependent methyltransferase [Ralstonia pickettii]WKZ85928.1 class I SAM-dependent methyltransferase [Ralstonia pickettii]
MHIERLSFEQGGGYDGLEAAIHIARYGFVKGQCKGKRILDIACGEGYGSRMMVDWGAAAVEGVDISEEAVAHARNVFGGEKVNFTQHSAEAVDTLFEPQSFDLIVSLETVEHVEDPAAFLRAIKRLLKPGGTIVVSCPNDWWYFPEADRSNPFHRRKYSLDEFQELARGVLGEASGWYLGGPITGFCNLPLEGYVRANAESGQILMRETRDLSAVAVPAEPGGGPRAKNASYFVGVWGDNGPATGTAAVLPLSMDAFKEGIFQGHLHDADRLREELRLSKVKVDQLASQLRSIGANGEGELRKVLLRNHALLAENELMREGLTRRNEEYNALKVAQEAEYNALKVAHEELRAENLRLSVAAARYVRLRSLIPAPIRMPILRLARSLRRLVHGQ